MSISGLLISLIGLIMLIIGIITSLKSDENTKRFWAGMGFALIGFLAIEFGSFQFLTNNIGIDFL
jgi:uncharacterized membrane protein